jgi:hypothetical protein
MTAPSPPTEHHRAALELLGVSPAIAPERQRLIAERERACGVAFPPAVVEWFALEPAHDRFEPLEQLGDADDTRQGRLRVALENQVAYYVRLDEGDDPPVYDEGELLSLSFSNFVFDMVCKGRLGGRSRGLFLSAESEPPQEQHLEALGRRLRPGPATRTEGFELHRFFGPHEYATVRWEREGRATWTLEGDSPVALDGLRAAIDEVVTLPPRREGAAKRLRRRFLGR